MSACAQQRAPRGTLMARAIFVLLIATPPWSSWP
jgi:hypothetical protein